MTYLRMRKFRQTQSTQSGSANTTSQPPAEPWIEIQPAEDTPGAEETKRRAAAVTTKPRRSLADPAISEGQSRSGSGRTGTLHKPVHAG